MALEDLDWSMGVTCKANFGIFRALSNPILSIPFVFFSCPKIGQELKMDNKNYKIIKIKERGNKIKVSGEVFYQPKIFYRKI